MGSASDAESRASMTDQELAEMTIEDRNRILDAWLEETETDLEFLYELTQDFLA